MSHRLRRGITLAVAGIAAIHAQTVEARGSRRASRTYSPSAPLYIHAKVVLADSTERSAAAFVSSENLSVASLQSNRELGATPWR